MLQYKKVLIANSFVSIAPIDKNNSKICILVMNITLYSPGSNLMGILNIFEIIRNEIAHN
jgi:hypothetical protein